MSKMNPEIKARWVAALRSGEYKQGAGELRSANDCFCCLGVLCNLKDPDGWLPNRNYPPGPYGFKQGVSWDYPPRELIEWAGVDWYETNVTIRGVDMPLAEHNDAGITFAEIADAIEAQL